MKAATICQPYAHLVAFNLKPIENRTWPTSHRGELAIHAGKSRNWMDDGDEQRYPDMAFGAIVAVATLSQCLKLSQLPADLRDHEHANGPWCWVLSDVIRLPQPVSCRGAQGLWLVPSDVEQLVREQIKAAA